MKRLFISIFVGGVFGAFIGNLLIVPKQEEWFPFTMNKTESGFDKLADGTVATDLGWQTIHYKGMLWYCSDSTKETEEDKEKFYQRLTTIHGYEADKIIDDEIRKWDGKLPTFIAK